MNITRLKISGYKNLDIKLKHEAKVITLIGNNGSGKSNLLEALSIIFRDLYTKNERHTDFDYSIAYEIDIHKVIIKKVDKTVRYKVDGIEVSSITHYLPKKVVAIYSGDSDKLWKTCYEEFYNNFITDIYSNEQVYTPKMLLINKYYWDISLLSLLLSSSEDNKVFVKNVLGIQDINSITFDFDRKNYASYAESSALLLIRDNIDKKDKYTIDELQNTIPNIYSSKDIYNYLYLLYTPQNKKIIKSIDISFKSTSNDNLTTDSLSEGEKKLLLLKSAFEFAVQEDSLFLLDEPDAHVHINNKEQIIELIRPFKDNRQVVLTTHSPTVTKSIDNDELFMLDNGSIIDKEEQEIIDHLTSDFWNKHQQSSFLSSNKPIILLVEGKTDEVFIEKALKVLQKTNSDYEELDFEYLPCGGADAVKLMADKFTPKENQTMIALFDRDKAGWDAINKILGVSNEWNNTNFGKSKELDKLIVMPYPIRPYFKGKNFNIEDYFPKRILNKYALESFKGLDSLVTKRNFKRSIERNCNSFKDEDFKHFKKLFDLILEAKSN